MKSTELVWVHAPPAGSGFNCSTWLSCHIIQQFITTIQPQYLHNLISVQPPRNTRGSYHVTLARPPTSSSLRITDRSFRYASPYRWNQLPSSLRQPHSSPSVSDFPADDPATSSYSLNSPLSSSITLSFTPGSRPTFFTKSK